MVVIGVVDVVVIVVVVVVLVVAGVIELEELVTVVVSMTRTRVEEVLTVEGGGSVEGKRRWWCNLWRVPRRL